MPVACATGKIRLFVPQDLTQGGTVAVNPDQARYLAAVMRVKPGDPVLLFNGRDGEWSALISQVTKKSVSLTLSDQRRTQDTVAPLTLAFAPVKRAPLDYLAQKATELGVARLLPVFTRRTVVSRVNLERLRANVVEAAEQCGRLTVPEVAEPMKFDAFLAGFRDHGPEQERLLFCDEAAPGEDPTSALEALNACPAGKPWHVIIGPEGGFDPAERNALGACPGALRVGLGPRIMRADTAAIAALTLWQATLGDWYP